VRSRRRLGGLPGGRARRRKRIRLAAFRSRASNADRTYWEARGRPISVETLRDELDVGSKMARALVRELRAARMPVTVAPMSATAGSGQIGATSTVRVEDPESAPLTRA
jgi:hypothetical protein